jgi:2-polyprenyl-6-hydroxyphenyl methylase/3-demethylubiquinone-9 3-methyltransferase
LEVIEHVPDPAAFIGVLAGLLEPGGTMVLSTLNRTRRSWLTAKLGAEYVLRMLPVGTHDWKAFIAPAELAAMIRAAGLRVGRTTGLVIDPLTGQWRAGRDMNVNYMMAATR